MSSITNPHYNEAIAIVVRDLIRITNIEDPTKDHDMDCVCNACMFNALKVRPFYLFNPSINQTYPYRPNWIHRAFDWNIQAFDVIPKHAICHAIAAAMRLPKFHQDFITVEMVDGHAMGENDFVLYLADYCAQINSSLPIMLLGTDIIKLPQFYKMVFTHEFMALIGQNNTLEVGKQAVMIIDSLITFLLYESTTGRYALPDIYCLLTGLDTDFGDNFFTFLDNGKGKVLDFVIINKCFPCEEEDKECTHLRKLINILNEEDGSTEVKYDLSVEDLNF